MGELRCFQHPDGSPCSICMEQMTATSSRTLGCDHIFHKRCLERWKRTRRTCPICRAPFDMPLYRVSLNIHCIHDGERATSHYDTTEIETIAESFGIDQNLMNRSITDITFEIDPGEDIELILRDLGITSFRLPNSNTVRTT
jgi:hypothetical protein